MTLQHLNEWIEGGMERPLPGLPWRVTFPFIATLDTDSFYTPEDPEEENNSPGTSAAYGKGYCNLFKEAPAVKRPLTEAFLRVYFPEEGLQELTKLMRDKGWARPFGNPLYNLWGGTHQNFSNWKVTRGEGGQLHLVTKPLTLAFYQQLRPYFAPQLIEQMQELPLEEILFDTWGNSLWVKNGVMTGVWADGNPDRFTVTGHKEIVGGTGRFRDVSGSFHFAGYGDNRTPAREGEPTSTGRMGLWGTVDCWWPFPTPRAASGWSDEESRALVQPNEIYRDNILQQVINQKLAPREIVVQ